jgi:hypothetical protein
MAFGYSPPPQNPEASAEALLGITAARAKGCQNGGRSLPYIGKLDAGVCILELDNYVFLRNGLATKKGGPLGMSELEI